MLGSISKGKKKLFFHLLLQLILVFVLFCKNEDSDTATTTASLLAAETGADGCTIAGISNQIKAGYTNVSTTSQSVQTRQVQDTFYAIVQVKGAQIGTTVIFNQAVSPNIYVSTSCPLNLDSDALAVVGTAYSISTVGSTTTISFLQASSYLIYMYSRTNYQTAGLTVITAGTALSTVSDSALTDLLNGSSSTTFKFSCDNSSSTGICQNYYGAFTDCLSGGTKQTTKCTETNVLGSCKYTSSSIGTIVTVYTSPIITSSTSAQSLCTSGTYQSGTTVQTP
ncbi:hypothetical protein EHQ58_13850 [Leptospira ognonensis]|uniref:Uncharacterized protein n=1 Tax=Leptospira ognonensis TaxID=2484945 RepID=A0A4R9JXY5_9LEPT|nr:hypothetical protein [Leptospira ognonensis]TGL57372.1 hypothetical protein EHQ58_13850 [Leptospira ognonensis]